MEQMKRHKFGSGVFKGMMAMGLMFDLLDVGEYILDKISGNAVVNPVESEMAASHGISFKGSDSWKDNKKSCEDAIKGLKEQIRYNNNKISHLQNEIASITVENATGGVYTPKNFITYKKNSISDLSKEIRELEQKIREMQSFKMNHL